MKNYRVKLLYHGKERTELFEAKSKRELYDAVFTQFPRCKILQIREVTTSKTFSLDEVKEKLADFFQLNSIDEESKIFFLHQLAVMSDAGISILNALQEIQKNIRDRNLKNIIENISNDINNGQSLSDAFQKFELVFGTLTITMVKLGDKTGDSAKALFKLVEMLEEIRDNKIKVKKAMAYPRNVMIAMVIAMVVMINFVIPKFQSIFDRFHSDLPFLTKLLLGTEQFFSNYGGWLFFLFSLLFLTFSYYS